MYISNICVICAGVFWEVKLPLIFDLFSPFIISSFLPWYSSLN